MLLCKTVDQVVWIKTSFGTTLENLVTLEQEEVFIPRAGRVLKREYTVLHSIIQSVDWLKVSQGQTHEGRGSAFPPRTKKIYSLHTQTVEKKTHLNTIFRS